MSSWRVKQANTTSVPLSNPLPPPPPPIVIDPGCVVLPRAAKIVNRRVSIFYLARVICTNSNCPARCSQREYRFEYPQARMVYTNDENQEHAQLTAYHVRCDRCASWCIPSAVDGKECLTKLQYFICTERPNPGHFPVKLRQPQPVPHHVPFSCQACLSGLPICASAAPAPVQGNSAGFIVEKFQLLGNTAFNPKLKPLQQEAADKVAKSAEMATRNTTNMYRPPPVKADSPQPTTVASSSSFSTAGTGARETPLCAYKNPDCPHPAHPLCTGRFCDSHCTNGRCQH